MIQEMKTTNNGRKSFGDPSSTEFDFQVYTLPYKNKIKQEAKSLTITIEALPLTNTLEAREEEALDS